MRTCLVAAVATLACAGGVNWEPDPAALAHMRPEERAAVDSLATAESAWRSEARVLEAQLAQKRADIEVVAADTKVAEDMADESRAALKAGERSAAKDIDLLAAQRAELTARRRFLEEEIKWLASRRELCVMRAESCQTNVLVLQARATGARAGIQEGLADEDRKCCRRIETQLRRVQQLERTREAQRRAWEVLEELWREKRDERVRRR